MSAFCTVKPRTQREQVLVRQSSVYKSRGPGVMVCPTSMRYPSESRMLQSFSKSADRQMTAGLNDNPLSEVLAFADF